MRPASRPGATVRTYAVKLVLAVLGLLLAMGTAHAGGTLRVGLEFDPDVLDPARETSYTNRIVFTAMCDALLDVGPDLTFVPQLATSWTWSDDRLALTLHLREGVVFQDGEPFTAEAMRLNMERYRTAPESLRRTEMAAIAGEDALDAHTLRVRLKTPYAPLLSLLANRPGTPLSPRILGRTPDEIGAHPVCAGPFAFKERVAQDHILLERFPGYWNAAAVTLDRVMFRTVPDSTVRRVNLQAGALDIVDKLAPSDMAQVQADPKLRVLSAPSIGFQPLALNVANGPGADTAFGRDARVREAFEKSIDRAAINQVVFDGRFVPSNQTEVPGSRYWDPARPVPPRDLDGARRLLKEAGQTHVPVTFVTGNDPVNVQIGEMIQAMAGEAGFDVKVVALDSAGALDLTRKGMFQASMLIWSGRPDPDGNASYWVGCKGSVNWTGYCNPAVDALLTRGAQTLEPDQRVPIYRELTEAWMKDRPYIVLFHFTWIWGVSARVEGFAPRPDGLARLTGVNLRS